MATLHSSDTDILFNLNAFLNIKKSEGNIILSDSVVAGNPYQPGDENIDGNDFFN